MAQLAIYIASYTVEHISFIHTVTYAAMMTYVNGQYQTHKTI